MAQYPNEEILNMYQRYVNTRHRIQAGQLGWDALAEFFTEDAIFVDPAWGRVEGIEAIRRFLVESTAGLEDWSTHHEWAMAEDDRVVARWSKRLPGRRADGGFYEAPGYSLLVYDGDGHFSYEEDLLNTVHVEELIRESGWKPPPSFNAPPRAPRR